MVGEVVLFSDCFIPSHQFVLCLGIYQVMFHNVCENCLDSATRMLVYKLVMSNEAMLKCGIMGVSFSLCIRALEFYTLKALGRGAR